MLSICCVAIFLVAGVSERSVPLGTNHGNNKSQARCSEVTSFLLHFITIHYTTLGRLITCSYHGLSPGACSSRIPRRLGIWQHGRWRAKLDPFCESILDVPAPRCTPHGRLASRKRSGIATSELQKEKAAKKVLMQKKNAEILEETRFARISPEFLKQERLNKTNSSKVRQTC